MHQREYVDSANNINFFLIVSLQATESVKSLQAFREKLPAFKMKQGFLNSVSENQVICYLFFSNSVSIYKQCWCFTNSCVMCLFFVRYW